jgi:hypothetical protein
MPCCEFKHRYWFIADTPNNATISSDIWSVGKDLWRWADSDRLLKYRGCEKCVAARHYADIGKQLLFANNRNRVRGALLCLSQDGASMDEFVWKKFPREQLTVKRDLSNDTTVNQPLFSFVNTFKAEKTIIFYCQRFLVWKLNTFNLFRRRFGISEESAPLTEPRAQ